MTLKQYLIGTCLGCKKCLYCGIELSIRKRMCLCDKTVKPGKTNRTDKVKVVYPRMSTPNLSPKQLEYIQECITRYEYSLDLNVEFKFTFCPACNSAFQRKRNVNATKSNKTKSSGTNPSDAKSSEINPIEDNLNNSIEDNFDTSNGNNIDLMEHDELSEKSEADQIISFNLIIKRPTGPALPSKWLEIEVSSIDDILADVHHYVGKLTGDKEIMPSDYLVSFKSEKATGVGAQLADLQDYKRFLSDYKNLLDKKKNMVILVSLKKEKKQKRKVRLFIIVKQTLNYCTNRFIFLRKYLILKNQRMRMLKKKVWFQN
jgi:hypothetical protein